MDHWFPHETGPLHRSAVFRDSARVGFRLQTPVHMATPSITTASSRRHEAVARRAWKHVEIENTPRLM